MKETPQNLRLGWIRATLSLLFKVIAGLALFLGISIFATFSLFLVYFAVSSIVFVEPPPYPNAEYLGGPRGSGSGGYWSYENYCTSDDYADVIEFMDDFFPNFRFNPTTGNYSAHQTSIITDIISPIIGYSDERYVVVYVTTPDDIDTCNSGTYFVIYQGHWD